MRSFEERKEEIFHRSEKRIAQRKKTVKRVVLTCVPLALCVTVLSGYLALGGFGASDMMEPESAYAPNFSAQDSILADQPMEAPETPEMPELATPVLTSAQLQTQNGLQTYTDPNILWQLALLLPEPEIVTDHSGDAVTTPAQEQAPESDPVTAGEGMLYGKDIRCTLKLTYADGSIVEYKLANGLLTGPEGSRALTGEQLEWMESLQQEAAR